MPTLKEPEASLSYVQCFLYLVSSSINVIFISCSCIPSGQTSYVCICIKKLHKSREKVAAVVKL